ncbi:hypothetical protein FSARC_3654 [Fusarium sarcochroum]|uniref:Uncharacterized protein n=1 Tax=Fusarium sarcochroum TaxID=1208366 RepID=A0A8H4U340_9HYPO|nr:hypothetical protein FSARC_3654 [Fusarium sarcochroum]
MDPFLKLPAELRLQVLILCTTSISQLIQVSPVMFHEYLTSKACIQRSFLRPLADFDDDMVQDAMTKNELPNPLKTWNIQRLDRLDQLDQLHTGLLFFIEDYLTKATATFQPRQYLCIPDIFSTQNSLVFKARKVTTRFDSTNLSSPERRRLLRAFLHYELECKIGPIKTLTKFEREAVRCVEVYVRSLYAAMFAQCGDSWLPEIPSDPLCTTGLLYPDVFYVNPDVYASDMGLSGYQYGMVWEFKRSGLDLATALLQLATAGTQEREDLKMWFTKFYESRYHSSRFVHSLNEFSPKYPIKDETQGGDSNMYHVLYPTFLSAESLLRTVYRQRAWVFFDNHRFYPTLGAPWSVFPQKIQIEEELAKLLWVKGWHNNPVRTRALHRSQKWQNELLGVSSEDSETGELHDQNLDEESSGRRILEKTSCSPTRQHVNPIPPIAMDQGIVRVLTDTVWNNGFTQNDAPRPDTSTILRETLFQSWDLFTKIDKGGDLTTAQPITLLYDACLGHNGSPGEKTCPEICTDPESLFDSWKTIWQCLSLASLELANTTFSNLDQPPSQSRNETSKEQITSALWDFAITNETNFDGKSVLNLTYECAAASCRDKSMGECSLGRLGSGYAKGDAVQWIKMYEALESLCGGLESDINIDIAGPGVLITYITQTAMVVFAWLFFLLLKINKLINTSTSIFTHLFRKPNPRSNLLTHRVSGLERLERTNLAHATSTFLAELHEAQCFFVVAIEIALINASSRSAIFTGAENWQSLLWNRDSIQFLAGMGAWPIILGQISLRRAQLDSMYYLLLSTLALVLAGVAADTAANPDPDRIYKMFQGQNVLEECGGHPSLRTFCVEERDGLYWYTFPAGSIYAFLGLLAILWWIKLWSIMSNTAWYSKKHESLLKRQSVALDWTKWTMIKLAHFAICVAEAGAIACICFGLAVIRAPLLNLLLRGETGTWSVGQLVAVLIWAPVISKYAHLVIRKFNFLASRTTTLALDLGLITAATVGVEKGFRIRLSKAFEIVKRTELGNGDSNELSSST